jgi:hypothetical protein
MCPRTVRMPKEARTYSHGEKKTRKEVHNTRTSPELFPLLEHGRRLTSFADGINIDNAGIKIITNSISTRHTKNTNNTRSSWPIRHSPCFIYNNSPQTAMEASIFTAQHGTQLYIINIHPQLLCTCTHAHVHTCKRLLLHRACPPPAAQLCRTRRSKPHQTAPTRIHWLTIVNAKKHPQHFSVT